MLSRYIRIRAGGVAAIGVAYGFIPQIGDSHRFPARQNGAIGEETGQKHIKRLIDVDDIRRFIPEQSADKVIHREIIRSAVTEGVCGFKLCLLRLIAFRPDIRVLSVKFVRIDVDAGHITEAGILARGFRTPL